MSDRIGEWIQTALGNKLYPLDPRPEEIFIEDIAHALSNQCRYGGHCIQFFSVAQHSVLVSFAVPEKDRKWGLLHDAPEYALVDLPRPIKNYSVLGDEYKKIEAPMMGAVCTRFGLLFEEPESVSIVDKYRIILAEKRDIMGVPPAPWRESGHQPLPERIVPWTPERAHFEFLKRFTELFETPPKTVVETWARVAKTRRLRPWGRVQRAVAVFLRR